MRGNSFGKTAFIGTKAELGKVRYDRICTLSPQTTIFCNESPVIQAMTNNQMIELFGNQGFQNQLRGQF